MLTFQLIAYIFLLMYQLICFLAHSLITNRRKKTIVSPNMLCRKTKSVVWVIWSDENFKLIYLRKIFYCFFIACWPLVPKIILVWQWRWRQIVQQDMNSYSVSHFRSSLIYNTIARHERHECDTSETRATQVLHKRHECSTRATRTTRLRYELKKFKFDN